jgi:tetratricopeptide (TPR) repeat protein
VLGGFLLLFGLVMSGNASELFDQGAEAFLYNRPQEAAEIMERVIVQEPVNGRAYLYLAMSYEQLEMYERAIATLNRAQSIPGIDQSLVLFNIGNNYLHLGQSDHAETAYTDSIEQNPLFDNPYLNRANLRVAEESYEDAISDYRTVLELAPGHAQRAQIERMIALLENHLEAERIRLEEERLRLEEEERLRQEEAERLRLEEEERRRALLSDVLDSIKTATDETENISAGGEDIDDYEDEFDIAD